MKTITLLLLLPLFAFSQDSLFKKYEKTDKILSYMGPYLRASALPVVANGGNDPIFTYQAGMSFWYAGHIAEMGFIHESDGFSGFETSVGIRVWGIEMAPAFDMSYVPSFTFSFLGRGEDTKTNMSFDILRLRWSKSFKDKFLLTGEIPLGGKMYDMSEGGKGFVFQYGVSLSIRYLFLLKDT